MSAPRSSLTGSSARGGRYLIVVCWLALRASPVSARVAGSGLAAADWGCPGRARILRLDGCALGMRVACGAVFAVLFGSLVSPSAASPGAPRIAVASGGEIVVLSPNDGGRTVLTGARSGGANDTPAWSPDGQHLAFVSSRDHRDTGHSERASEIYVMNADGSAQRRLTFNGVPLSSPSWSSDGRTLVFSRDTPSRTGGLGRLELWTVDVTTGAERRLTVGPYDLAPTWSPDGSRVAFDRVTLDRKTGFHSAIYTISADGSAPKLLARIVHESA